MLKHHNPKVNCILYVVMYVLHWYAAHVFGHYCVNSNLCE